MRPSSPKQTVTRRCYWIRCGNCSRLINGRRWSSSSWAFRTYPSPPSIDRNCATTPACWRTTLRCPHRPTSIGPAPANLSVVFDHFVSDTTLLHDSLMMETAGAQCLLLAGFFEDQMRQRHNIRWYAELGASFFSRAAVQEQSPSKARLLNTIARRFEPWRRRHARLSRELRNQPYVLIPPKPPTLIS